MEDDDSDIGFQVIMVGGRGFIDPFMDDDEDMEEEFSEEEEPGQGFLRYGKEREFKRMKIDSISALAKNSFRDETLLEALRYVDHIDGAETDDEARHLMDLILKNTPKFPSKLRPSIAEAKAEAENRGENRVLTPSQYFYNKVCKSVADFLCGIPANADDEGMDWEDLDWEDWETWHGPDSNVDTKDEIELAIRLCPDVYRLISDYDDGTFLFLTDKESVSFIPLIVSLNPQFPTGVHIPTLCVTLLNNVLANHASRELDKLGFGVFKELVFDHYVTAKNLKDILIEFLYETVHKRTFGFIAKRLWFLAQCDPYGVLTVFNDEFSCSYLFAALYDVHAKRNIGHLDIRLYQLALELGRIHFPDQLLGFGLQALNFEYACKVFGEKAVKEVLNDEIASYLEENECDRNETLTEWVFEAAPDASIGPDGLYTLIRFDPTAVVMNSTGRSK